MSDHCLHSIHKAFLYFILDKINFNLYTIMNRTRAQKGIRCSTIVAGSKEANIHFFSIPTSWKFRVYIIHKVFAQYDSGGW